MTAIAIRIFTFKVGRRTCRLALPARFIAGTTMKAHVEWSPQVPRKLTREEQAQFAAGRDAAFAKILGEGQHGVMVELDAGTARLTAIESEHGDGSGAAPGGS